MIFTLHTNYSLLKIGIAEGHHLCCSNSNRDFLLKLEQHQLARLSVCTSRHGQGQFYEQHLHVLRAEMN